MTPPERATARGSRVADPGPLPLVDRLYAAYCRSPDHPMKLRLEGWLRRALRLRHVQAESPDGVRYNLFTEDFVQHRILREGAYEPHTLALLRRLLADGDTMVDVGGHVGQYALHAAALVGERGRIVAVEPNPRSYEYLRRNIVLNRYSNVTAVLGAIAERPDVLTMVLPAEGNWGGHRVLAPSAAEQHGDVLRVLGVPLSALLSLLDVTRVDVLKIDVEGFELTVLRSLDLSSRHRPTHILLEFLPELASAQGSDAAAILALLRSAGYALRTVAGVPYADRVPLVEENLWAVDEAREGRAQR